MTAQQIRRLALALIALGIAFKFYGLSDPWKRHDHYNFGGIWTSTYAECLKTTPLAISKGVPHTNCWGGQELGYYRAHPPTLLFALWGWTSIFGDSEAAYRSLILLFSTLNIGWMFLIGRRARPQEPNFPYLAAAFQSVFLGNLYFGTHIDFIGEFTVFFVLAGAYLALSGRLWAAGFASLAAGITAWPGFISFGPLWLYTLNIGRGRKRILGLTIFAGCVAMGEMMWLHQTTAIGDFLKMKLANPGYIKKTEKGFLEPLRFLTNAVSSLARLLSPVFATFAVFEFFCGDSRALWASARSKFRGLTPFHHAVLLSGGTGFLYAIIGHEYFMVHVFLYLLTTPSLALLSASFAERALKAEPLNDRAWLAFIAVLFAALYPYGIFKSNAAHDAINSAFFIGATLTLIALYSRRKLTPRAAAVLIAVTAATNISQMINYRNEPDTERSFCEKARAEFKATGQPVHTHEEQSDAKTMRYCRDIPIVYE